MGTRQKHSLPPNKQMQSDAANALSGRMRTSILLGSTITCRLPIGVIARGTRTKMPGRFIRWHIFAETSQAAKVTTGTMRARRRETRRPGPRSSIRPMARTGCFDQKTSRSGGKSRTTTGPAECGAPARPHGFHAASRSISLKSVVPRSIWAPINLMSSLIPNLRNRSCPTIRKACATTICSDGIYRRR